MFGQPNEVKAEALDKNNSQWLKTILLKEVSVITEMKNRMFKSSTNLIYKIFKELWCLRSYLDS